MKNPKRLRLPARLRKRAARPEEREAEALADVPRITNETVAEHREEVLASARKYIYRLPHSERTVVKVSASLLVGAAIVFLLYCGLALYRFQFTSGFIYDVTRVIPFPAAKAGPSWVSYESYLFELRRNLHYYEVQQKINFNDPKNKPGLVRYKQQALQRVIDYAYLKQLAAQHHVSVSEGEVDNEVALLKTQNRLGSNDKVFQTVLNEFWGWNIDDFKRELHDQMLAQKVVAKLDTTTNTRAQSALVALKNGTDFAQLAGQVSDDPASKGNGGQYPGLIDPASRDVAPQVLSALQKLQPGQFSGVINTGYSLEIVKLLDKQGDKLHAAHIQFNYKDIQTYIGPLEKQQPPHRYIKV
jgi:hypothetical protein